MRSLRFALALAVMTPLAGCGAIGALTGLPTAPVQVANNTVMDEQVGIAVETLYAAVARAGALAFRTGIVAPSTNPAVQQDTFCALVRGGEFEPTDRGSQVAALECRLRAARDLTRSAYRAGNASTYRSAAAEAIAIGRELLALIRGN